ncbi:MAG: hypothetical protein ACLP7O_05715 [Terracidiphilus sp.]
MTIIHDYSGIGKVERVMLVTGGLVASSVRLKRAREKAPLRRKSRAKRTSLEVAACETLLLAGLRRGNRAGILCALYRALPEWF